jgi:DNA-binding response OmpR family regulator
VTQVILAVEDDEVMARMYVGLLTREDWKVVVAPTLADATRALDQHRVSVVLLDLFLPDGDGRTWLRELRGRPEHGTTPVIVVAGSVLVEAQVDCYELGADTMLSKPVAAPVLQAAVAGAISRGASRAAAAGARATQQSRIQDAAAAHGTVLLAEDDAVVSALVQHRLKREGFDVRLATDGVAALEIANTTPLVLAVLDVMIPGMDGFELLGRLRRNAATARVPIVMLTGLGGERDVERALALGADDYVLKPFSPVELTARVNRLVRRQ